MSLRRLKEERRLNRLERDFERAHRPHLVLKSDRQHNLERTDYVWRAVSQFAGPWPSMLFWGCTLQDSCAMMFATM